MSAVETVSPAAGLPTSTYKAVSARCRHLGRGPDLHSLGSRHQGFLNKGRRVGIQHSRCTAPFNLACDKIRHFRIPCRVGRRFEPNPIIERPLLAEFTRGGIERIRPEYVICFLCRPSSRPAGTADSKANTAHLNMRSQFLPCLETGIGEAVRIWNKDTRLCSPETAQRVGRTPEVAY